MLRRIHLSGLLAAALLFFAGDARAQDISSPYEFIDEKQAAGAFGGYVLTDAGALDLGPESAPAFGVRYSLRVSGPFMLEGEATYLPSSRAVFDTTAADGVIRRLGDTDLSLAMIQAALRFNVTGPRSWHGIQPYLLFGGGGAFDVSDSDAAFRDQLVTDEVPAEDIVFDFGTTFAAQIGAGIEWFASRRITVRADARDAFWQLTAPAAFTEQNDDVPSDEWVQNFFFLLGLSYRF